MQAKILSPREPTRAIPPKNAGHRVQIHWLRLEWPLLPGCISKAKSRCGQPHCACKAHPPKLHGPYYRWTGLVGGKPTTITLAPAEARECQRRIQRFRRLQESLRRWMAQGLRCAPWNQRQN
jgi:uncharacterized protein DUF6788